MTFLYIACMIIGGVIWLLGRELWVGYIGMAIQLLGPSLVLLSYNLEITRRGTYRRAPKSLDGEFRRYVLALFAMSTLLMSMELAGLALRRPVLWCATFVMLSISSIMMMESLKHSK